MTAPNMFSGLHAATVSANHHPKIPAGFDGDLKVLKTEGITTRFGPAFVAECEVLTSNMPAHPVGSILVYMRNFSSREAAFNNLLSFIVSCWGYTREDTNEVEQLSHAAEGIMMQACHTPTQNQLTGRACHVVGIPATNQAGNPYVKKAWGVATGQAGTPVGTQAPQPQTAAQPPTAGNMPAFQPPPVAVQGLGSVPQIQPQMQPQMQPQPVMPPAGAGAVVPQGGVSLTPPVPLPQQQQVSSVANPNNMGLPPQK